MTTNIGKMAAYLRNVIITIVVALAIVALSCSLVNALSYDLEYMDDGTGILYDVEQCCYVDIDTYHEAYGYVYDENYGGYVYYNGDTVIYCGCEVCEYVKEGNEIIIPDDGWLYSDEYYDDCEDDCDWDDCEDELDDEDTEEYEVWYDDEEAGDDCDRDEVVIVDDGDWDEEEYEAESWEDADPYYMDIDETDEYDEEAPIRKAETIEYPEDDKVIDEDIKTEDIKSTGSNNKKDCYGTAEVAPEDADETAPTEYSVADTPKRTGTEPSGYTEEAPAEYYEEEPADYSLSDSTDYDVSESIEYDMDGSTGRPNEAGYQKAKSVMSRIAMILGGVAGLITMIGRRLGVWR